MFVKFWELYSKFWKSQEKSVEKSYLPQSREERRVYSLICFPLIPLKRAGLSGYKENK